MSLTELLGNIGTAAALAAAITYLVERLRANAGGSGWNT